MGKLFLSLVVLAALLPFLGEARRSRPTEGQLLEIESEVTATSRNPPPKGPHIKHHAVVVTNNNAMHQELSIGHHKNLRKEWKRREQRAQAEANERDVKEESRKRKRDEDERKQKQDEQQAKRNLASERKGKQTMPDDSMRMPAPPKQETFSDNGSMFPSPPPAEGEDPENASSAADEDGSANKNGTRADGGDAPATTTSESTQSSSESTLNNGGSTSALGIQAPSPVPSLTTQDLANNNGGEGNNAQAAEGEEGQGEEEGQKKKKRKRKNKRSQEGEQSQGEGLGPDACPTKPDSKWVRLSKGFNVQQNQIVLEGSDPRMHFCDAYTWAFWIKVASLSVDPPGNEGPSYYAVLAKGNSDQQRNPGFWIETGVNSACMGCWGIASGTPQDWNEHVQTSPAATPLNQWQHVAMTHYPNKMEIFFDGVMVASRDMTSPPQPNDAPLYGAPPKWGPPGAVTQGWPAADAQVRYLTFLPRQASVNDIKTLIAKQRGKLFK